MWGKTTVLKSRGQWSPSAGSVSVSPPWRVLRKYQVELRDVHGPGGKILEGGFWIRTLKHMKISMLCRGHMWQGPEGGEFGARR